MRRETCRKITFIIILTIIPSRINYIRYTPFSRLFFPLSCSVTSSNRQVKCRTSFATIRSTRIFSIEPTRFHKIAHFYNTFKNTVHILDRKQNQSFFTRRKKKKSLKIPKKNYVLPRPSYLSPELAWRQATSPFPSLKFLIGERCVISASAWIMRNRVGGGKRGAHSRVCGAADKGPSLDNYLPFAQA